MPVFVVVGHRVNTDGLFTLNDLAGSTGRLDILLRCVNSTFFLSNDIRRDAEIYLVLLGEPDAPKTIRFAGSEIKYLNPDERSTAALVKNALMQNVGAGEEINTSPGVYVSRRGLKEVLDVFEGRKFIHLMEAGTPINNMDLDDDLIVVLGGQYDLTEDEENMVKGHEPTPISLGPNKLHANHCITIFLNELDISKQ